MTEQRRARDEQRVGWLRALLVIVVVLEASMYSVLTPLLPGLVEEFGLSESQAGILFSAYIVGSAVGAVAGAGILALWGPRRAMQIALVMIALSLVVFGLSTDVLLSGAVRFVGGLGGGVAWVAAMSWALGIGGDGRQGEAIGSVMGASIFGTLLGPIIGTVAVTFGRDLVLGVVAAVAVALAVVLQRQHADPARPARRPGDHRVRARVLVRIMVLQRSGANLFLLAGTYGALFVLLPLRLAGADVSASWIGWLFAGCSGISAVVAAVSGRWTDRIDGQRIHRAGMVLGAVLLMVLAVDLPTALDVLVIVLAIGFVFSAQVAPALHALTVDAEGHGASPGVVAMLLAVGFSLGESLGGSVGPLVSDVAGESAAFGAMAGITVLAVLSWSFPRRAARRPDVVAPEPA